MNKHSAGTSVIALLLAAVVARPGGSTAHAQCDMQKLLAPVPGVKYGNAMAISADSLVISDKVENDFGIPWVTGLVYVYRLVDAGGGASWLLESTIPSPLPPSSDGDIQFGNDIDIDGDTMIVADISDDSVCPADILCDSGAAYVFQRDSLDPANWNQVTKLTAPDAAPGDIYGRTVAIEGDFIFIGADRHQGSAERTGAVYVYQRDAGGPENWGFVTQLTAFDESIHDQFGFELAIEGDTLVVASLDAEGMFIFSFPGAAYVFQRNVGGPDNWGFVQKLTASDRYPNQGFARSGVSISGDTIAVGSWLDDLTCTGEDTNCGSAYLFERHAGGKNNWGEVRKITASDVGGSSIFGTISLSGDQLLVGAFGTLHDVCFTDPPPFACAPGATYLFHRNVGGAGNWGEVARLQPDDIEPLSIFGFSTMLDGDRSLVRAVNNGVGAVYAFRFADCECAADGNNDRTVNVTDLLNLLSVWGSCPSPCPMDTNGDGQVNVTDLLGLLAGWGPCP